MSTKRKVFKCHLVNIKILGQQCGWGEGRTIQEAEERALEMARKRDPNAYIHSGQVYFDGGPVLL